MAQPVVYSERLGAISDAQFEAAVARLGLGRFRAAAPISTGLFGQNVFLTTSEGEFVLRGAPHWVRGPGETAYRQEDRWQFAKEAYFVDALHAHTAAPAPWPYLRDEASDIFGWPYAIMPRMPGACYDDRSIRAALSQTDQHGVAEALGAMLAEMQRLTAPEAGDFDVDTIAFAPYPGGALAHIAAETERNARDTEAHGALTGADRAWIAAAADAALAQPSPPVTYAHCDYKLNNLTVERAAGGWRVSGLFDFHEARFSDGAADLVRQACSYLDADAALARRFVGAYRAAAGTDAALAARAGLLVINERLKIWGYFTRPPEPAAWAAGKTFRQWAEPYLTRFLALL